MVLFNLGRTLERIPGREGEARAAYRRVIEESLGRPELEETMQMATVGLRELDARTGGGGHGSSGGGTVSPVGPIVMSAGGAALVAGVIVGAFSLGMDAEFRDACADLTMCPTRLRPPYDEMRAYSTAADVLLVAGGAVAVLGVFLAGTGDVNGDGFDDLVVGAFNVDTATGRAYVYHGGPGGLDITEDTTLVGPDGMLGGFGYSVSGAGDVDGDNFADVVVGAPAVSSDTGRAHVFHGGASGLATTATTSLTGPDSAGGVFGYPVAGRGGG